MFSLFLSECPAARHKRCSDNKTGWGEFFLAHTEPRGEVKPEEKCMRWEDAARGNECKCDQGKKNKGKFGGLSVLGLLLDVQSKRQTPLAYLRDKGGNRNYSLSSPSFSFLCKSTRWERVNTTACTKALLASQTCPLTDENTATCTCWEGHCQKNKDLIKLKWILSHDSLNRILFINYFTPKQNIGSRKPHKEARIHVRWSCRKLLWQFDSCNKEPINCFGLSYLSCTRN